MDEACEGDDMSGEEHEQTLVFYAQGVVSYTMNVPLYNARPRTLFLSYHDEQRCLEHLF